MALLIALIIQCARLFAQQNECYENLPNCDEIIWYPDHPINNSPANNIIIEADNVAPRQQIFLSRPGNKLYFQVRFHDKDFFKTVCRKACADPYPDDCPPCNPEVLSEKVKGDDTPFFEYDVVFTTNQPAFSSFSNGEQSITIKAVEFISSINQQHRLYENGTSARLTILPNWTAADGNIVITATVNDKSTSPAAGDPKDVSVSFSWTIQFSNLACPVNLEHPNDPQVYGYLPGNKTFVYRCLNDTPVADFLDLAITEEFAAPQAFFTINDLTSSFKRKNKIKNDPTNPNAALLKAISMLFSIGDNATFIIGANERFSDTHSAIFFKATESGINNIKASFTQGAYESFNDVIGFSFGQTYNCGIDNNGNPVPFASATLSKKWQRMPGTPVEHEFQLRKQHDF
jgi:hypothetical protein